VVQSVCSYHPVTTEANPATLCMAKEASGTPAQDFFKGAPPLLQRVAADWDWLRGVYIAEFSRSYLSEGVKSSTRWATGTVRRATELRSGAEASVASLTTPSPAFTQTKDAALDFRRRYKGALVAAISLAAVVPAALAGPSKFEQARIALRNFTVACSGSTALLYPELMMRVGSASSSAASAVESKVLGHSSK
jgi:hypothetical protein